MRADLASLESHSPWPSTVSPRTQRRKRIYLITVRTKSPCEDHKDPPSDNTLDPRRHVNAGQQLIW